MYLHMSGKSDNIYARIQRVFTEGITGKLTEFIVIGSSQEDENNSQSNLVLMLLEKHQFTGSADKLILAGSVITLRLAWNDCDSIK